jgi:hypothetical protein
VNLKICFVLNLKLESYCMIIDCWGNYKTFIDLTFHQMKLLKILLMSIYDQKNFQLKFIVHKYIDTNDMEEKKN